MTEETVSGQCTTFPDGKPCADPDCTWGGAYDTHWCRDVGDMVRPGLSKKWQDLARWKLEPRPGKTLVDLRAAWEKLERRGIITGPLGGAGWHHVLAHFRYSSASDTAEHIWGGRCQSGKRWFWFASCYSYDQVGRHCDDPVCSDGLTGHEYGWADTEDEAVAAYADACVRLGGMDPRLCRTPGPPGRQSAAVAALKQINTAKRKARPPKPGATGTTLLEYLYAPWSWSDDYGETHKRINVIPIVKKTAKRIYYDNTDRWDRNDGVITLGFINREDFETDSRCKDTCCRDIPAGLVCGPHGRDFAHCVHFGGDWRGKDPACWTPPGCRDACPVDTPGWQCEHGRTWDHCPHGERVGDCSHGSAAGAGRLPGRDYRTVYATREAAEEYLYRWEREQERKREESEPEIKRLRKAMANVHPDRGGTDEEFIAARERYEQALRRTA